MERYVRVNRKRPSDAEWLFGRDILKEWKDRDARSITPREVVDLLDSIVDRGAPVQANRTARLLGQMYRFGIQRRIVDSSPVILLTPPGGREKLGNGCWMIGNSRLSYATLRAARDTRNLRMR